MKKSVNRSCVPDVFTSGLVFFKARTLKLQPSRRLVKTLAQAHNPCLPIFTSDSARGVIMLSVVCMCVRVCENDLRSYISNNHCETKEWKGLTEFKCDIYIRISMKFLPKGDITFCVLIFVKSTGTHEDWLTSVSAATMLQKHKCTR